MVWTKGNTLVLNPANNPDHLALFPTDWDVVKRNAVADELNNFVVSGQSAAINDKVVTFSGSPNLARVQPYRDWLWLEQEETERTFRIVEVDATANTVTLDATPALSSSPSKWGIPLFQELSNNALRVLAGLPSTEDAFTQRTIQPLDPNHIDTHDRRGPGDPDDYTNTLSDLRLYIDTLDGRAAANCYFYRAAYVDDAHNRSALSLASPPVGLPSVVPPRKPVITKILGGDRQIILKWASNRETDLAEYRVYRLSY